MPEYLYKCPWCGNGSNERHSMEITSGVICRKCGAVMQKVPQMVSVNWGGNKPSDGGTPPLVSQMIADAPRQRDEMQARKEDGND